MAEFDDTGDAPSEETPLAQMVSGNVSAEEYTTQGKTTVATRRGYRFVPNDPAIPVVTSEGLNVTAEQADALIEESDGLVYKVTPKEGE